MKVVYVPVGKEPEIKEIDGTLEAMQELVGGNIETVPYENIRGMVCVLNEKGKIDGMDPNRLIFGGRDFIAGDFFVAAVGPNEDGDMDIIGLNDRQEEFVMKTIDFGRFYKE